MSELIDERLSNVWNSTVHDAPNAYPENMWDLCRLMAQYDLVVGNRQDVAAIEIGPFRAVSTIKKADVVNAFVDSILPVIIAQYCTKQTVVQAVTGPLLFLTKIFCQALQSGSLIKDPLVWSVLMYVRQANLSGKHPMKDEILKACRSQFPNENDLERKVEDAIVLLMSVKPVVGKTPVPVLAHDEARGLVSSV